MAIQFALRVPASLAQKGHDLAVQRADYYRELYVSGRWRHYGTEEEIKARVSETAAELARWRVMLDESSDAPEMTVE